MVEEQVCVLECCFFGKAVFGIQQRCHIIAVNLSSYFIQSAPTTNKTTNYQYYSHFYQIICRKNSQFLLMKLSLSSQHELDCGIAMMYKRSHLDTSLNHLRKMIIVVTFSFMYPNSCSISILFSTLLFSSSPWSFSAHQRKKSLYLWVLIK